MTRAEIIQELHEEYLRRLKQDEDELDARIAEVIAVSPEIRRLREQNLEAATAAIRCVMTAGDAQKARALASEMKQAGRERNARIRELLVNLGKGGDYFTIRYRCPVCKDTGYVGEAPARFCDCFENEIRRRMFEDGSMAAVTEQCFESFNLNIFPEEGGQREYMEGVRRVCEDWAEALPRPRTRDLMLLGTSGTGKTFLLNCVYERAVRRGISAVRITAFRMLEAMRRQHFTNGEDPNSEFDKLLSAPLLLIDDLGTEPMMNNITVEYLLVLLNERAAAGLNTMIVSNLMPLELKERYGDRIQSRLTDRSRCTVMQLKGKDLRHL